MTRRRRSAAISIIPEQPVAAPGGRAPRRTPRSGTGVRVATALVLIPAALLAVWIGGPLYSAVVAAMTIFLIFEWTRLVRGAELQRGFYALSLTAIIAVFLAAGGHVYSALGAMVTGGVLATFFEWPKRSPDSWPFVGACYLIGPAVAALWLRAMPERGFALTLLVFIVVWGADSGAYVAGRSLGGPKLAPRISPNKTWSGAIGGLLTGGLLGGAVGVVAGLGGFVAWFGVGLALAAASVAGDLAESQLKRSYGVKDSGSAFPGHGGVLDRLDGFLFAVVALAILVLLGVGRG